MVLELYTILSAREEWLTSESLWSMFRTLFYLLIVTSWAWFRPIPFCEFFGLYANIILHIHEKNQVTSGHLCVTFDGYSLCFQRVSLLTYLCCLFKLCVWRSTYWCNHYFIGQLGLGFLTLCTFSACCDTKFLLCSHKTAPSRVKEKHDNFGNWNRMLNRHFTKKITSHL